MMEMRIVSCFVIILISLAYVDARYRFEPMSMDEGNKFPYMDNLPPEFICDSCLEPSRKAEKTSSDPKLFEKLGMLSSEVCHILLSDLKVKCLETSKAYMHRTGLLLKGLFDEETLCSSTGLCLVKSMIPTNNGLLSVSTNPMELTDEKPCTLCRSSVKDIFADLNQPKMRMKVMEALLEYCEEVVDNEQQCKQRVYKYAPLILAKLGKLKANDLCRLMGMCDEGISV